MQRDTDVRELGLLSARHESRQKVSTSDETNPCAAGSIGDGDAEPGSRSVHAGIPSLCDLFLRVGLGSAILLELLLASACETILQDDILVASTCEGSINN